MPDPLSRVRAAATARRAASVAYETAEWEYREAVIAAHAAGRTYAEIGAVLGVSRQAVQQLAARAGRSTRA